MEIEFLKHKVIAWTPFSITMVLAILILYGLKTFFAHRAKKNIHSSKVFPQLFQFFMGIIFLVVLILNSPLTENTKGQLLSLLGILLTAAIALSSTNFLGNLMGGLMIRTLNKFGPGDFLRIGDQLGRVTELGLLHTEIQSDDRDLLNYPNIYLVSNPIRVIRSSGTIIWEEVSLGYDINHNEIKAPLLNALKKSGLSDPFVHIQKLGDHSVTYRASGFLADVKTLISVKSELREKVLDELHSAGIEIVSPTFMNQRVLDPSQKFIPSYKEEIDDSDVHLPEEIIFDKAEAAESIEKLKEKVAAIDQELDQLHDEGGDSKTSEDREAQIDLLEKRKQKILEHIEEREQKEKQKE